jgi:DNA-binding transcriptional LysR family regulator
MQTNDLNLFITAAEYGSLTKAAAIHHTVQSNVSARIKSLEDEVGIKFFVRSTRHIELTKEGERFLKLAKGITSSIDEFKLSVTGKNTYQRVMKIGCIQTTAALRAPEIFRNFSQQYPDIEFKLKTGTTPGLIKEVLSFKLDGAFVTGEISHPELDSCPVIEEELCIVSAATFPGFDKISGRKPIKLIVFDLGCSYRDLLNKLLDNMEISDRKFIEFDTLEGIINTVENGLGITLLPVELIKKHYSYRNLKILPYPQHLPKVQTVFIKRKDLQAGEIYSLFFESIINWYS